jgi:hypothetical protein
LSISTLVTVFDEPKTTPQPLETLQVGAPALIPLAVCACALALAKIPTIKIAAQSLSSVFLNNDAALG